MNEIPVNIIPLNTQIRNGKKWFFFKTPTYDKPIDMEYDLAVQAGFCPKDWPTNYGAPNQTNP